MVDEIAQQLKGQRPGCFIVSVGGGGLLRGVLAGMKRHGWQKVPVLAIETQGADCFDQALKAGHVVELPEISR
jgi:L-serine/L-threonine ammonia-lyase